MFDWLKNKILGSDTMKEAKNQARKEAERGAREGVKKEVLSWLPWVLLAIAAWFGFFFIKGR